MREKEVKKKLWEEAKVRGGVALKFVSPGMSGVPDRLVLLPGGLMCFAELKAPGKKARPLQLSRHRAFRRLGFMVFVIDSPEKIKEMFDEIQAT